MPDAGTLHDIVGRLLPFDFLAPHFMRSALLGLLLLVPITAVMGVQVVNFGMAFFTDAISHSVFAGVALGALFGVDPRLGTIGLAILVGIGVTAFRRRAALSADSVIGVFFSGVVAFGLAASSRDRAVAKTAQSFLYGDVLTLGDGEIRFLAILLVVVYVFQCIGHNRLLYIGLDPVLAEAHGVRVRTYQYAYAALLSLTAVLAVWTVGVFLVSALLVLPAAAARNLSRSAGGMFWWALAISLFSAVAGLAVSAQPWAGTAAGPTVILVAFAVFVLSVPAARLSGARYTGPS